jgi:DNA-binding response OmpR family regulator
VPDVVVATDSEGLFQLVRSIIEDASTHLRWVRRGEDVRESINHQPADLVVADMQIGAMGGIAVALDLRLEAGAGRLEPTPVLVLLDRRADVFLARRSRVEGWLIKPLDPLRLRRAVTALLGGGNYYDATYQPDEVALPPRVGALPSGVAAGGLESQSSEVGSLVPGK